MDAPTAQRRARARLRLARDQRVLHEEPLQGVAAEPVDGDLFKWHANLHLDGEHLHFEIFVPSSYPADAPSVFFPTGLPHPNCFKQRTPDGRDSYFVCLDMLGNVGTTEEIGSGWSSAYDLRGLLAQLQAFILDDRNMYQRFGGLCKRDCLAAAHRYVCPCCPHQGSKPSPVPRRAAVLRKPALLRALAPPDTARRQPRLPAVPAKVRPTDCPAVAEPRPWRDVQRLATHLQVLSAGGPRTQLVAGEGWQTVSRSKALRVALSAQELRRQRAAVRLQRMVRARLARALKMCLRRLRVRGAAAAALWAAETERAAADASAASLLGRLTQAQAAEAEAKAAAREVGTLQERAVASALQSLARKRRNLRKKLQQASELAAEARPLSEKESAKAGRTSALESELRALGRKVSAPAEVTRLGLSQEVMEQVETAGFHELYDQALLSERESAQKAKRKLRHERRSAKWAAEPATGKATRWCEHIGLARKALVKFRVLECRSRSRAELSAMLGAWRTVARSCRAASGQAAPGASTEMRTVAPRDGSCPWRRLPYPLQVGVVLPMVTYRELLVLAAVSCGMQSSAEDGCLWSVQMSRHHPLSTLTAASMKDWKYAFQCELNQAVAGLECFHTKRNLLDDASLVLGVPIEWTINPKTQETDYIYSSMDFLSHEAFTEDGVRKTVYKESFTHWLPLYFSEAHWARCLPLLRKALVQLLPHRRSSFRPDMALEVFAKMVNTLVVLVCDKGVSFSDRAAKAYCLLHRWALRCMEEWPELRQHVDGRVDSFCRGPQNRGKDSEPNLGEFMALLLLTSRPWARVAMHALEESMDRQVLWLCTEFPGLANVAGPCAPSDEERLAHSWKAGLVGRRLYAFHVSCFALFKGARPADELARDYDRFYGQPGEALLGQFRRNTKAVLEMGSWQAFFQLARVKGPAPSQLAEMLRQSVKNSRKRGYHTDGMDFNRVHASGTSKILQKGESYFAAATLKAVDLEDHWSWAEGQTKYLDATCLVYDAKHEYVGLLDYNTRTVTNVKGCPVKEGALVHSGDQMDNEKQCGYHKVHIQLDALPAVVQYLYITVSSWAGARLRDIRQPSVRLLDEGRQELCRYGVEGADGGKTAILMCVLHRRPERSTEKVSRWALEAIGDVGDGAAGRYEPIYDTIQAFRARKGW